MSIANLRELAKRRQVPTVNEIEAALAEHDELFRVSTDSRARLLEENQQLRNDLADAIGQAVTAAVEDRDRDWSHALKEAVESQFSEWSDFHEWPATPDVETVCAWLQRVVEAEWEACAYLADSIATKIWDYCQSVDWGRGRAMMAQYEIEQIIRNSFPKKT